MKDRRISIFVTLVASIVAFGLLAFALQSAVSPLFISYDFIAYYTSAQLFLAQNNPYDKQLLLALQLALDQQGYQQGSALPAQMWYPPWFFPLTCWLFLFDLPAAATVWFLINILLLLSSIGILWKTLPGNKTIASRQLLGAICFYPIVPALLWGQIGPLLTFAISSFLWATERRKDSLAGLCLIPLSFKPHLFIPFGLVVLWWVWKEKRYRPLMTLTGGVLILASLCELWVPNVTSNWLSNSGNPPSILQTATLAGFFRAIEYQYTGEAREFPLILFPLLSVVGTLFYLKYSTAEINLTLLAPPILCISLAFAPYAHTHDQVILLVVHVFLLRLLAFTATPQGIGKTYYFFIFGAQVVPLFFRLIGMVSSPFYFWIPLLMLLLWMICIPKLKNY